MNTWVDYIVIAIFFINIGMGLMRGLFREIISIMALILAFVITIKYTYSLAQFLIQTQGAQDVIFVVAKYIGGGTSAVIGETSIILVKFTYGLSLLLLFVGSFSVLEAVVQLVPVDVLAIAGVNLTLMYRLLGGALGFIRGFAFTVVFLFVLELSPISQSPAWTQSYFVPIFSPSVNKLMNALGGPIV